MKYRYVSDLIEELVTLLFKNSPTFFKEFDFLIPVPLHQKRLKDRGFNQSFLIGLSIAEKLGIPIRRDLLIRSQHTQPQFGLKLKERNLNVKDVFQLKNPSEVKSRKIYGDTELAGNKNHHPCKDYGV